VEILNRASEAVNLVRKHTIQFPVAHIPEHFFQRGTVERIRRISSVLVDSIHRVVFLALAVRLQSLSLRFKRAIFSVRLIPAGHAGIKPANGFSSGHVRSFKAGFSENK